MKNAGGATASESFGAVPSHRKSNTPHALLVRRRPNSGTSDSLLYHARSGLRPLRKPATPGNCCSDRGSASNAEADAQTKPQSGPRAVSLSFSKKNPSRRCLRQHSDYFSIDGGFTRGIRPRPKLPVESIEFVLMSNVGSTNLLFSRVWISLPIS